jgi:hypothetical protein
MTYGMVVNGENNRLLFSTNVNSMFFQGKATLHQIYSSVTIDYMTNTFTGATLFNYPEAAIYEFRITLPAGVSSILPFIYNSIGKRVAFLSIFKLTTTEWQMFVYACTNPNTTGSISPSINVPTIYVFSDFMTGQSNTGYGINTFDSNGKISFSTNAKPLIFKSLYNGNVRFSDLTVIVNDGITYVGNGPIQQNISLYNSVLPASSISKPAIFFAGNQTGRRSDANGVVYIYEATARFVPSTSQLAVEWAYIGSSFSLQPVNQQSTSPPFTAMVIDAAQYD